MAGRSRQFGSAWRSSVATQVVRLFPLLLAVLALVPRLVALGRYITPDEATWVYRSLLFREALRDGRWADTLIAGHPGVTTTWLGVAGMTVQMWFAAGARASYDWLTKMAALTPDNVAAFRHLAMLLSGGRVAVALVNSLGVVVIYFLLRRLWGRPVAIVAALFLALDPFTAGLSGLLHVDGLSATFVTLSLLALAIALSPEKAGRRPWLWHLVAGGAAGLAALTKSPTLLLLPLTGLAMLLAAGRDRALWRVNRSFVARLAALLRDGLVWGAAFLLVVFALYPALWASPAAVLSTISGSANRHLGEALRETFFLGRAAFDHGPLFYPAALLWRLSPVGWLAIIPAAALLRQWWRDGRRLSGNGLPIALLLLWCLLFLASITVAAKKFDRYILPTVPALLVLAAFVWCNWSARSKKFAYWAPALIVALQVLYWGTFAAYPLAAYNPLAGGPWAAAAVLPAGWGEGIGTAGRWLTQSRPGAADERVIAGIVPAMAPFFAGTTLVDGLDEPESADYVVLTLGGRQLNPANWNERTAGLELLHVVRFGGLEQAWIYRNPSPTPVAPPPALTPPVTFGDRMALVAYEQTVVDDAIVVDARWRRLTPLAADERFIVRLAVDDGDDSWIAQETDLLDENDFFPPDWPAAETGVVRYRLELPRGIPPATYHVAVSVVDARTGGQLLAHAGDISYGTKYRAGAIEILPPEGIVSASRLQIPHFTEQTWLDGQLRLLGYGEIPLEALAGSELPVDLFWHVPTGTLPPGLHLAWRWQSTDSGETYIAMIAPLSRYDTGLWRTGETLHEKYRVPMPATMAPGYYELVVEPLTEDEVPLGAAYNLAAIRIDNIDRLYVTDVPVPFMVSFDPLVLLGLDTVELTARPGDAPELTLFWQKNAAYGQVYTAFVHLLDESGAIVQNADHWPGGLPTNILADGQIVIDRFAIPLPPELPPGEYRLRVGLYSADTGTRLPAHPGAESEAGMVIEDYVILPFVLRVTAP